MYILDQKIMPVIIMNRPLKCLFALLIAGFMVACGETAGINDINRNFPSLGNTEIQPSVSLSGNAVQVVDVAPTIDDELIPGSADLSGAIGSAADQSLETVLCVIIDSEGGNADLEVCSAEQVDQETTSSDRVCPNSNETSFCSSSNTGTGPDFCEVTGARDYALVIINRSYTEVRVAYQIIDVSLQPNQSCDDLGISENTIQADTQ